MACYIVVHCMSSTVPFTVNSGPACTLSELNGCALECPVAWYVLVDGRYTSVCCSHTRVHVFI